MRGRRSVWSVGRAGLWRGQRRVVSVAGVTIGALALSVLAASAADGSSDDLVPKAPITAPSVGGPSTDSGGNQDVQKVSQRLREQVAGGGRESVFVQLTGTGAAATARSGGSAERRSAEIASDVTEVAGEAKAADKASRELFRVSNAMPGLGLTVDADSLAALEARPDVVKVSPLVPKSRSLAGADALVQARQAWQQSGQTGEGVRIGVIDTGIDYTHADFGGPGTVAAFDAAQAVSTQEWTPTPAVAGGYDFAGDDYDADQGTPPVPDPNPLDCEGHGTHVAGIAAGRGVSADGSTFAGDHTTLTDEAVRAMKIAPGLAPRATLYGLRIFGCAGSSNLTIPALDWALDPNGDGDFADHLDIVNLSLGSPYGSPDDPDSAYVDKVAELGVVPVVAAGNDGDATGIGSTPATAVRSIAVANEVDGLAPMDGLRVDAPTTVAGVLPGQVSVDYRWPGSPDVSGTVATLSATNPDGCDPLSAQDAAAVAGKVAWSQWNDDSAVRRCGSVVRTANLAAAGAIGVVLTNDAATFSAGIAGTEQIPVFQLTQAATATLAPAAKAGTLAVTFSDSLRNSILRTDPLAGTVSQSSSRMGDGATIKPDLAGPGDSILSAMVGGGSSGSVKTGTSMATPATAGVAALVRQQHPEWTVEQVKAALMNSAVHDVTAGKNGTGPVYGPARVGAGGLDAREAVSRTALAFNADDPGAVGLGFGAIAAPIDGGKVSRSKKVTVQNNGTEAATYRATYARATDQSGVTYTVKPASVKVAAGASTTITVTATVDPVKLRRTIDPTMSTTQTNPYFTDRSGNPRREPRQYLAAASGRILVHQVGSTAPALRVPVYASGKPVSTTTSTLVGATDTGGSIVQHGAGVVLDRRADGHKYQSRLSVLTLGESSPKQQLCAGGQLDDCLAFPSEAGADLRYVGAGATTAAAGQVPQVWFGISTWESWSTLSQGQTRMQVTIDTSGDGRTDFYVVVEPLEGTDLLYGLLLDAEGNLIGGQPVNLRNADEDTNVFDTDTMLVGVNARQLGLHPGATSFPITYAVQTTYNGTVQDTTEPIGAELASPALKVDRAIYADVDQARVPYRLDPDVTGRVDALVLHLYGADGRRAEVVTLRQ